MKSLNFFFLILTLFSLSAIAQTPPPPNRAAIFADLQSLYPYFTRSQLEEKVAAAKDPDHFLRSFIPYYYSSVKNNRQWITPLLPLANESGWCMGDAHFSNFGVMLDGAGNPLFTANDMDDSGPCPLMTDTLKFLTSVILSNPRFDMGLLLQAYQAGLNRVPDQYASTVLGLLQQGRQRGRVINPKALASPSHLLRPTTYRDLSPQESSFVNQTLRNFFGPDTLILDDFEASKNGGGSHDLTRFMVLVKLGSRAAQSMGLASPQLIEFKQEVVPGIFPLSPVIIPNTSNRILTTLKLEQGQNFSRIYNVARFSNMDFLISPQWYGNIKINIKDYSDSELFAIALDEFYTLGAIQSQTASSEYIHGLSQTTTQDWVQSAVNVAQFMTIVFQAVR